MCNDVKETVNWKALVKPSKIGIQRHRSMSGFKFANDHTNKADKKLN